MRSLNRGLLCMAGSLLILGLSSIAPAQVPAEQSSVSNAVVASTELPDSPGALQSQQSPGNSTQQENSTVPATGAGSPPARNDAGSDQRPQRPVGTAAAEAPKVSGITAAQPAGVAIAPAKQHRARAIVIKVGAIIAAGAAVGGVVALTKATPSKPPGAH